MGRPFDQELGQLSATYEWARNQPIDDLVHALDPLRDHPLIVVGSGGSLSAAHLAATLHERKTGQLARVVTPLELRGSSSLGANTGVLLMSAGGRNPDILQAFADSVSMEPRRIGVICGTRKTPLGKLAQRSEFTTAFEYSVPTGKDGFLATNSLLALFTFLLRAHPTDLPLTFPEVLTEPSIQAFLDKATVGNLDDLLRRETLLVLYGPGTKSAAIDLESKLTEAALARVQLADFRNFGHGRHHWLAKRPDESAVFAFAAPEDLALCMKTLNLLPKGIPTLTAKIDEAAGPRELQALMIAFALTSRFGKTRGIDPGRPSVPEFGRKLYHLKVPRQKGPKLADVAILRKCRAAGIRATDCSSTRDIWTRDLRAQLSRLRNQEFASLIFDYDGTLCSPSRRLQGPDPEIVAEIERLVKHGITVGIATGRGASVRRDLQGCLSEEARRHVLVAYYNGAEIGTLTDDNVPNRADAPVAPLLRAHQRLILDPHLRDQCEWSLRCHQISIQSKIGETGLAIWQRVQGHLRTSDDGVRAVTSSRSVDILAPGVSKRALIEFIARNRTVSSSQQVLCVGDKGCWPGNDFELLAHEFALSTDEVSPDPGTCWNLAPLGCLGTEATLSYLRDSKFKASSFRLLLREYGE